MLVTQMISDIQVIVEYGLESLAGHILIHLAEAAAVIYLELLVALSLGLLAGIFALMIADTGGNSGGDLGRGYFHDTVPELCALP